MNKRKIKNLQRLRDEDHAVRSPFRDVLRREKRKVKRQLTQLRRKSLAWRKRKSHTRAGRK